MRVVRRSDLATCEILGNFGKTVLHLASCRGPVNSALPPFDGNVTPRGPCDTCAPAEDTILTQSAHLAEHPTPLAARSSGPLTGKVRVPGDKSISHRALILGALAVGETRISGLLEGKDVLNTAKAMRTLGASVERTGDFAWSVRGVGVAGFAQPETPLDFGNSGTGCRLVRGAVAGCPISAVFDGDASLRSRPMRRGAAPFGVVGGGGR